MDSNTSQQTPPTLVADLPTVGKQSKKNKAKREKAKAKKQLEKALDVENGDKSEPDGEHGEHEHDRDGDREQPAQQVNQEPELSQEIEDSQLVEEKVEDPVTLIEDLPTSKVQQYIPEEKQLVEEYEPTADQLKVDKEVEVESAPASLPWELNKAKSELPWETESNTEESFPWLTQENLPKEEPVQEEVVLDTEAEQKIQLPVPVEQASTATGDLLPWELEAPAEEKLPWEETAVAAVEEKSLPWNHKSTSADLHTEEKNNLQLDNTAVNDILPWDEQPSSLVVSSKNLLTRDEQVSTQSEDVLPWDNNVTDDVLPWEKKPSVPANVSENVPKEDKKEVLPWDEHANTSEDILPWEERATGEEPLPWENKQETQHEESSQDLQESVSHPSSGSVTNETNETNDPITLISDFPVSQLKEYIPAENNDEEEFQVTAEQLQVDNQSESSVIIHPVSNEGEENAKQRVDKLESIFGELEPEEEEEDFFNKLKEAKKQVHEVEAIQEKQDPVKEAPSKKISLAFLDDDDLLFDDEPKEVVEQQKQPVQVATKHSYIPSGPTLPRASSSTVPPTLINKTTTNDFNKQLNDAKKKNDAYDFPMPIVEKVRPAPRVKSSKYGPSSSASTPGIGPPPGALAGPGRKDSTGSITSSTSKAPVQTPSVPAKSFFEELPIEMPKPAPRHPRVPKVNTPLRSPMNQSFPPNQSQQQPQQPQHQAQVNLKPNPYAPKVSNAPPVSQNVRSGVVPPPQQIGAGSSPSMMNAPPNLVMPPPQMMPAPSQMIPLPNQMIPPPMVLNPTMAQSNQLQPVNSAPPMIQPQVILPQQQQQQLYPNPNLQHTRKISNPPVINTNVAKSASSGSATSPYVPKAGPYAPSANRKTHSRANSLVGAKGKELNPYAPVLPIVNQANMNSTSLPTGVIPPSNPVAPPAIGPYQHGSVPQQQMVPQQFSQNSQASLPLPTQNRIRGLSFTKSRLGQPAPKVQDPNALLQRQFPIFSWSNSGNIASLIPNKNTNVYGNFVNETINVGSVTKLLSFNESISSFPGPLSKSSSKTKKKDVEKWLENNIDVINKTSSIVQPDEILLNQILLALIQNNGDVSAKQFIESVCPILNPTVNYKSELPPVEIQPIHNIATPTAYKLDNSGLNSLLNYLQVGKTEEAIQLCVSKGDWAMALMISNIVGNEKFQKIASDYARMSFPFQVSQSKIHHLMPIVLKAINGASKSVIQDFLNVATEGDWATQHWRDIVSLIFINGSANALEFCIEFGKFLRGRPGLAIASDICFMLAGIPLNQSVSTANGVVFPIIGGETYLSSIYTEIYEMSIQLSPVNIQVGANGFPHLYPAKLKYAQILADYGLFAESQKYCDLLIPLLKPAGSSGGHQSLIWHELQNLALRLSSTNDQDQSWFGNRISKVNLDKMWGHLDKFIGGEEAKPKGEGVFSKFSPSVSRNTSTLDFAALGNTNNYNNPTTNNLPHHVRQQNYQSTMNNASDMSTSLNFSAPATSDSSYPLNGRVNAPPPLARTNTSSSMQRYAPGSHTNIQLHQHSQSQLQSQQQSQPQVPTQHQTSQVHQIPSQSASAPLVEDRHNYGYGLPQPSFESNPRYAPSNLSSLSLPLNQPDTHVKRVQKERFSPRISHNAPIVESPFAYMNPAGKISTLSIGSSYQATQNFSNPPQPIFHQPEGARRQSLEQPPTSVGNSVVPQPEESQQPQQYPTEQREDVYQAQNHIPLLQTTPQPFPPSIKKRNSIVSVTTENFGNPDAIRAQNHSPSAQSDISLDYEFKSNSRKYGEFNLIESPEKKRREGEHSQDSTDLTSVKEEVKKETQQLPPPPPPQSQQVELQQDEPQTEEVKEDELPPPPPPVLAKPPSTRSPASLLLKRANPYAPGGGSRAPSIRKNRYGPPTGTKSEFIPPVPQGDMFSYGGYQISTESDLQKVKETPTVENVEPKAESHDVSRPANVDVSFEEEETQTITTPQPKLFNRNQNFGGNNSPMKPPSVFNHYQGEVESSPNAGFGEFPVPGTPDYTTRANSVIGGNGGYYSSRLSQSHQSAMYQQYEVEDDTVKDFVPVVEEEDEDDEYLEKKEKELRLKQAEEAAKAKAAAAELEAKKQKKQQEEDAKRAKEEAESKKRNTHEGEGQSSGWFGSWLGRDDGKPKAIRAKLGEKSSFYYDEKLKKWINKDIPLEDQLKPSGPPPPPKMKKAESTPKSDGPSGSLPPGPPGGKPHGPPGGIPLTEQSINSQAGNSSSSPISSSGPPSKGPSLATAGLDDLLSIDTPSVGSTRKGKRGPKRGYVNVLTQE